jgi:FAD/FMN-containing dehydrogenase
LSGLREVQVDARNRTAAAGGGVTWEEYDTAAQAFGLASTGGTFADTGIAGLTLGGGIGFLQGTQGFAVDTLIGVRVVTATGEVLEASVDENADLFWAVRGAGANFGVVTHFRYRLQPVTSVYGGMIVYHMSAAREALRIARDIAHDAPDELTLFWQAGARLGAATVALCYLGDPSKGERLVASLRSVGPIESDTVRPLTYTEVQATFPKLPFGLRHYWKGHFLHDLPDGLVDTAVEHINGRPASGFGTLLIEFIGGAPLRVPADAMAFNQRSARVNASALGVWVKPEDDAAHIAWARKFADEIAPLATGAEYVNYMSADASADRVRATFGEAKYARLRELKKKYDPDNLFRFNQNIPPAE